MELDITKFFNEAAPMDYSASRAEIGQDAAEVTWRAACDDADDYALLDTDEKREAFKDHIRGYGAWSDDEIEAWSDTELNALCVQFISGDMREAELDSDSDSEDWARYYNDAEAGRVAGRISQSVSGDKVYYYLGN
jgi:hypothetical protein